MVLDAVREVLPRMPDPFNKLDVLRELAFEPRRSTFYEALQQLRREGRIGIVRKAGGKQPAWYRRIERAS